MVYLWISVDGGESFNSYDIYQNNHPEVFDLFPIEFLTSVFYKMEQYRLQTIKNFSVPSDTSEHTYNYTYQGVDVRVRINQNYSNNVRQLTYRLSLANGSVYLSPLVFQEFNPSAYPQQTVKITIPVVVGITGSDENIEAWKSAGGRDYAIITMSFSVLRTNLIPSDVGGNITVSPTFSSNNGDINHVASITAEAITQMETLGLSLIPAWPGPSSETGGTGGDFDDSTDSVLIPSLPTVAPAVSSNFITIYHPTMAELEKIGTVLWSSTISAAIKNLFSDPINAIISLHQTPFPLSTAAQKTEWFVGLVGTGVSMNKVTKQYLQYDFGSVDITEYWGNALDYSPYTKAQIYLPYIGIKDLDIDDIMASSVRVVYHVDILTGTCVAYIIVTKKDKRSPLYDTPTVMYQFTGNCNLMIPYTGADYSALVQNIITLAGAAVAAGATGGLSTQVTGADAIMGASTAMQSVGAVSGSKPTLLRGGQTGGVAGALGVQNCVIYLTRPNQSLAEDYASERGYPSNITATLGDLKGFTAVESCHVGIPGATDEELAEIENFLKSGVIL